MKNNNRRFMKKALAVVLSFSLVLSFSVPAFAAENTEGTSLFSTLFNKSLTETITDKISDILDEWNENFSDFKTMNVSDYVESLLEKYNIDPDSTVDSDDFSDVIEEIISNLSPTDKTNNNKVSEAIEKFLENIGATSGETVAEDRIDSIIDAINDAMKSISGSDEKKSDTIISTIMDALEDAGLDSNRQEIRDEIADAISEMLDGISLEGMEKLTATEALDEIIENLQTLVDSGESLTDSSVLSTIFSGIQEYINGIQGDDTDDSGTAAVLTVVTNDGTDPVTYDAQTGQILDLVGVTLERDGYTFDGWYTDEALTQPVTSLEITGDVTIYAKWTKNDEEDIPSSANPFTDVHENDYFYTPVLWAVTYDITEGTSATTFSPDSPCTRAQAMTFIWRAAGEPEVSGTTNFTDIKPSDYYYKAVIWGVAIGLTEGTSATTFSPNDPCTRAQIVTFLYRGSGSTSASGATPFTDVSSNAYYAKAVNWAVSAGVTTGTSATTFSPDQTCTRGQIVTFLYRFVN